MKRVLIVLISPTLFVLPLMSVGTWNVHAAYAATGALVGSVTFSADCADGVGVGLTFDGTNLWYSCHPITATPVPTDLYKATTTGTVIASYNVLGGLGALAYDKARNKIWLAMGWCAPGHAGSEVWLFDPGTGTAVFQFNVPSYTGRCLVDGLGYDASNDTLYHSFDGAMTIRHLSTTGVPQGDDKFPWSGSGCFNSGVAIGGNLLFEGSADCSHVWVVDKVTKKALFDFSTKVPSDANFHDESLTCDPNTFASLGKQVMWSKEAFSPMRAHAFEIPANACDVGGGATPVPTLSQWAMLLMVAVIVLTAGWTLRQRRMPPGFR